ncbi:MAG: N,N-dimethylformamidase beta subunit family domain-containing protein [Chthoniobacterales bacterium]
MSFFLLDCDEQSHFYAATESGALVFYQDLARNGTGIWAFGGAPKTIGSGWNGYRQIICGDQGVIYAIDGAGRLLYYRDAARNGTEAWAAGSGQVIGSGGWDTYARVFSGGDGILYAIATNGDLFYYRDLARNGTPSWSFGGAPQKIGNGWTTIRDVAYGGNGIIYAVGYDGGLYWYQDLARNGTASWAKTGAGERIGWGWNSFARILSGQDGVLYGVTPDGFLMFYRDLAQDGTVNWANNGQGQQIGSGWFIAPEASDVQGYCWPLSGGPGERLSFCISARSDYTVTYLRLQTQSGAVGTPVAPPFHGATHIQGAPPEAWADGCNWQETFSLTIPDDWVSGLYSAQCVDQAGLAFHIVFAVKPGPRRADFAVLANVNTWNAYNDWGGHSHYSTGGAARLSFLRPNPGTSPVDDGNVNHLTRAELWLLNWLDGNNYTADVYTDLDFHNGIPSIGEYTALILNTHPEYWSDQMRDQLDSYLANGGNLLYLGGNGLFERCTPFGDGSVEEFFGGDPSQGRDRNYFRNANPPRPERAVLGVGFLYNNYLTTSPPAPYQVTNPTHRFFNGTGLANGDLIGKSGHNGPASGWEMDTSDTATAPATQVVTAWEGNDRGAPPPGIEVLALGTNTPVDGQLVGHMTHYQHSGGGLVFSVGSLCFTGSFAVDPILQRIVANVLNECRA